MLAHLAEVSIRFALCGIPLMWSAGAISLEHVNLDVSMTDLFAAIAAAPHDLASWPNAWLNMVQDGLKKLGL